MRRALHTISLGVVAAGLLSLGPVVDDCAEAATSLNLRPVVKVEGEIETWLNIGVEEMSGHHTYQIGFPVTVGGVGADGYFPFSELEFPLDATFATAHLLGVYDDRWVFNATAKRSISDPDGTMKDRDWLTDNPAQLDVYSESTVTNFDGVIIDVDLSHKIANKSWGWFAGGVGFMYEKFDYSTALIEQSSPSGAYPDAHYVGDGRDTLLYEVSYYMPYLLGSLHLTPSEKFVLDARLGYAPYVKAEDRDQHLLRYKENTGDMEGWAATASLSASYYFTPYWFATAGVNHTTIEVEGDMDASFFDVYNHTVTEEAESSQTSGFLTAGYRFGPFPQGNGEKHEMP